MHTSVPTGGHVGTLRTGRECEPVREYEGQEGRKMDKDIITPVPRETYQLLRFRISQWICQHKLTLNYPCCAAMLVGFVSTPKKELVKKQKQKKNAGHATNTTQLALQALHISEEIPTYKKRVPLTLQEPRLHQETSFYLESPTTSKSPI